MDDNKKIVWLWEFKRKMDLLRLISFAKAYLKIIGHFFYVSENYETNFWWDKVRAEEVSEKILKKILNESGFIKKEFAKLKKTIKEIDSVISRIKKTSWNKLSNKQLFNNYSDYHETLSQGGFWAIFIRALIFKSEPLLNERIKELFKDDYSEVFTILTTSTEISFTQDQEVGLLKIGLFARQNNLPPNSVQVLNQIKRHLKKYAYIPCGYFDESPYNTENISERLKKILNLDISEIKNKIKHLTNKTDIKLKQIKFLSKIKNDKKLKNLIESVKLSVHYKEKMRGKINELAYYGIPLFEEITKRTNLSLKQFKMLTVQELKEVLLNNSDYKDLIAKRSTFMIVMGDNEGIHIFEGDEARKIYPSLSKDVLIFDQANTITGFAACRGKQQGIVRIIRKYTDSIKEGEILVASMTTPEYVPLMKKASAFVTDEGGITCHAAIVARELKKPCIIGTKIATQILKDGDLIEVDADSGIIKVLKQG